MCVCVRERERERERERRVAYGVRGENLKFLQFRWNFNFYDFRLLKFFKNEVNLNSLKACVQTIKL